LDREQILLRLREVMVELFHELDPGEIRLESRLVEDLDLDSIDAVDLTVKLQQLTGQRVDEYELRRLRTVGDVVTLAESHLARRAHSP
jgi:acyl carrier protein